MTGARDVSWIIQHVRLLLLGREWNNQLRFKGRMSTRSPTHPMIPKGDADKLSHYSYVIRDKRRLVIPPITQIHILHQGKKIQAKVGETLLSAARRAGVEIEATCNSTCACSTCHVHIDEEAFRKMPQVSAGEKALLESALFLQPTSRLSCQIIITKDLDGLEFKLPAANKRRLTKKIIDEIKHYYHGFRLLFIDLRVSSRYVWKILHGEHLTRREHRQLVRSTSDLFRLVPFSVFIIVPFMELLLPVFLKLFPGMLPSTFQTSKEKDTKIKNQLKVKLDVAKFLQQTLDDMALQAKGESHSDSAKNFAKFFEEVRASGAGASTEDIMKYSKLFEDEITLDSMSRQQLVACCRLLELQPIGTNAFLRFQLKMRLKALTADDQMIKAEGIGSLTVSELQAACRARGMRALGVPVERLQAQLLQWLDLNLNDKIPPSLLLLSRALYLPENIPTSEQLKVTIQSLPEIAAMEVKYNIGEAEGKVDNRTKLELIEQEEAEIKKEELQEAVESYKSNYDDALIDFADEIIERAAKMNQTAILRIVKEKSEKNDLTMEFLESIERDLDKLLADREELLSGKEPPEEEYDLRQIKEEMEDYHEEVEGHPEEIQVKGLRESKAARRLSRRVNKMVNKLDSLIDSIEEAKAKRKKEEEEKEKQSEKQSM